MKSLRGFVLFPVAFAMASFAQTNTAVIRGVVTDPAGANIAGAKVSATNSKTAVAYTMNVIQLSGAAVFVGQNQIGMRFAF